jgi:hypothetical protein
MNTSLPSRIKTALAVRLLGATPENFRRVLWDYGLPEGPDHSLMWLEQVLQRPITAEDYVAAERKLAPRREINRRHNAKRGQK